MSDEQEALQYEAAQAGLTNLTDHHLAQLAAARAAAERFVHAIPRDLPIQVEPAHIFRASEEA